MIILAKNVESIINKLATPNNLLKSITTDPVFPQEMQEKIKGYTKGIDLIIQALRAAEIEMGWDNIIWEDVAEKYKEKCKEMYGDGDVTKSLETD